MIIRIKIYVVFVVRLVFDEQSEVFSLLYSNSRLHRFCAILCPNDAVLSLIVSSHAQKYRYDSQNIPGRMLIPALWNYAKSTGTLF